MFGYHQSHILSLFLLLVTISSPAREVDVKVAQRKRAATEKELLRFNFGYSTNEYGLMEVAWHHFLNRYVALGGGVSCGVGFMGKNMPSGYIADSDYDQWQMTSGEEDEWNIDALAPKFLFSGIFKTPDLLESGRAGSLALWKRGLSSRYLSQGERCFCPTKPVTRILNMSVAGAGAASFGSAAARSCSHSVIGESA